MSYSGQFEGAVNLEQILPRYDAGLAAIAEAHDNATSDLVTSYALELASLQVSLMVEEETIDHALVTFTSINEKVNAVLDRSECDTLELMYGVSTALLGKAVLSTEDISRIRDAESAIQEGEHQQVPNIIDSSRSKVAVRAALHAPVAAAKKNSILAQEELTKDQELLGFVFGDNPKTLARVALSTMLDNAVAERIRLTVIEHGTVAPELTDLYSYLSGSGSGAVRIANDINVVSYAQRHPQETWAPKDPRLQGSAPAATTMIRQLIRRQIH